MGTRPGFTKEEYHGALVVDHTRIDAVWSSAGLAAQPFVGVLPQRRGGNDPVDRIDCVVAARSLGR